METDNQNANQLCQIHFYIYKNNNEDKPRIEICMFFFNEQK